MYHPDTTKGVLPTDARWAEAFRRRLSELRAKARGDLHAALAQAQRRADDAEAYAESLEARVGELEREVVQQVAEEKAAVYSERNACVVALVKFALARGWKAGRKDGDDSDWPVVYIDLPTGQVSWHLPAHELNRLWPDMPLYDGDWDGHTTDEKYARPAMLPASLNVAERIAADATRTQQGCACLDVARGGITDVSLFLKKGEKPVIWLGDGSQYRGR